MGTMQEKYVALVPVKPPALGKSRLVGLADDERSALAATFALDTVAACVAAVTIAEVLVATDDASFAVELTALGAVTIPDGVAMDLNGTLRQSAAEARRRWPELVPVALTADLPAVRAEDLDHALGGLAPGEAAYVADAEGLGTTLYTAAYDDFVPRFGPGSALAHDASGARPITAPLPRLRRDVDDLADLDAALALGVGPRTAERAAFLVEDGPSAV
jgi:2-phospho-L-lactate guanylyltransferase